MAEEKISPSLAVEGSYLVRNISKIIIPFTYKANYLNISHILNDNLWREENFSNHSLFQNVNNLITSKSFQETIGKRYILEPKGRINYNLPNNASAKLSISTKEGKILFSISQIELVLFETRVGFAVLEICYPDSYDIENLITANYLIKKLSTPIEYAINNDESNKNQSVLFSDLITSITNPLQVESYFEKEGAHPQNSHVFCSLILKQEISLLNDYKKLLSNYLFRLRRTVKQSYKPTNKEHNLEDNPEILHFFENSYWGVSIEGLVNIAYLTDDLVTNTFFTGTYWGNIKNVYYYLYILTLHQRYGLINLANNTAHLSINVENISDQSVVEKSYVQLYDLQEKISVFNIRSRFSQVSNNTHITKLYECLLDTLRVYSLVNKLKEDVPSLAVLVSRKKEMRDKKNQEEITRNESLLNDMEKRFHLIIVILTTIFVVINTTADLWEIFTKLDNSELPSDKTYLWFLIIAISIVWLLIVGIGISYLKLTLVRKKMKFYSSRKERFI